MRFDRLQLRDEVLGRMKVLARFACALSLDVVDADGDQSVCVERTVRLRVRVEACLSGIQTTSVLKISAYL